MKPFNFTKYIKKNPLLKESKLENELYNALENFADQAPQNKNMMLKTVIDQVLNPEQKKQVVSIIQNAKKIAKKQGNPQGYVYLAMNDIANTYDNDLNLTKQQFMQIINVLWEEPIGSGANEPAGDIYDQIEALGYTIEEYETEDSIGIDVRKGRITVAAQEFDNTDPENREDIEDWLKDLLYKLKK